MCKPGRNSSKCLQSLNEEQRYENENESAKSKYHGVTIKRKDWKLGMILAVNSTI